MEQRCCVCILASKSRRLYVGVTRDLLRRVLEHKLGAVEGFTSRYWIDGLVHFEQTDYLQAAIAREKELKGWRRDRKLALIEASNPTWEDLSGEWYDCTQTAPADSSLRPE